MYKGKILVGHVKWFKFFYFHAFSNVKIYIFPFGNWVELSCTSFGSDILPASICALNTACYSYRPIWLKLAHISSEFENIFFSLFVYFQLNFRRWIMLTLKIDFWKIMFFPPNLHSIMHYTYLRSRNQISLPHWVNKLPAVNFCQEMRMPAELGMYDDD